MLTPRKAGCDVSAVAFGQESFLLAVPIEQGNAPAIFIGLYAVSGQQMANSVKTGEGSFVPWPAQADAVITCEMLAQYPQTGSPDYPGYQDVGRSASITWFTSSPASGGALQTLLMAALTPTLIQNEGPVDWPIQVLIPIDPDSGAPLPAGAPSPTVMYDDTAPASPIFLVRDPANRVIGYTMSGKETIENFLYQTWSTPTNAPAVATDVSVTHQDGAPPAVAFYIDTAHPIAPTAPATTNPDGSLVAYNVYKFMFYNGGHIIGQASYYGMVEQLPEQTLTPDQTINSSVVTGIFDSPFPLPNANVVGFLFESTNADQGDVTYQMSDSSTTGVSYQVQGSAGVQSEGTAPSLTGFSWSVKAMGGGQSTWGTLTTTTSTDTLQQTAVAYSGQDTKIGTGVDPYATFLGSSVILTLIPYRFVDAAGNFIGDQTSNSGTDQAPRMSVVNLGMTAPIAYSYMPYMVTPGDLASYTPEAINATMSALYESAGWTPPADYFQDVLLANGASLNGAPYLQFQLSNNSKVTPSFTQLVQHNKTWGWNTSLSLFVGVGWNIPEGSSGKVGIALEFSAQGNWESDTSSSIGLSIGNLEFPIWGDPSAPGWADAVCNYVFLMLYLPPPVGPSPAPTLWGDELREFAQDKNTVTVPVVVDPGSQPWRVAFVVTAYQTNKNIGIGWDYIYKGNLPSSGPSPAAL
jgi:hypothetical protein